MLMAWLAAVLLCGLAGYLIGKPHGRQVRGLIMGLLFGPLGVALFALLQLIPGGDAKR